MAYITESNLKRIIRESDYHSQEFSCPIYKRSISFFNKSEIKELQATLELLKDPLNYFRIYYKPLVNIDSYRYIFPPKAPVFHTLEGCERLNSNFENYVIPNEIQEKGAEKVEEFRRWFLENKNTFENDPNVFGMRMKTRWNITTNPKAVKYDNSGITEFKIKNKDDIEMIIEKLINQARDVYFESKQNQEILKRFSKCTFLAYGITEIKNNNTGYNDDVVKELLKEYDRSFKKPIKQLLMNYYIQEYNTNINIDEELLGLVGLKKCRYCQSLEKYDTI